ncbi:hypothetical protein ACET3Z_000722 [Daucus carota]
MNQDDDDRSRRLFTYEDMIQGYVSLKRRKRGVRMHKDRLNFVRNLFDDLPKRTRLMNISLFKFVHIRINYHSKNTFEESVLGGFEEPGCPAMLDGYDEVGFAVDNPPPGTVNQPNVAPHYQDGLSDIHTMEDSLAAFPMKPLQALKCLSCTSMPAY